MTNEDKKIVADYMWWAQYKYPSYYLNTKGDIESHHFDLNDASLVVAEMQKRGEWVYFYDDLLDTYNDLCEDGKVSCGAENFSAWLFNSKNFFKAFVEWLRSIRGIL
jgi:hypothetical protein